MRVPDISFTSSNCAVAQNQQNKADEQQAYSLLPGGKLESNEQFRDFLFNESHAYSSADAFVRRALNSADLPAVTVFNSNENLSHYSCQDAAGQKTNTEYNSKFLYHQNERICVPNESSDKLCLSLCSNANAEEGQNLMDFTPFDQTMMQTSSTEVNERKHLLYTKPECNSNDLENDSNDNQSDVDDEDDDYLTSISSSTGSLKLSKHTYFPRGIVNPNYPGFQHLAHTLSEDIVRSPSWISYYSDTSDYEMDLSDDDSCDSIPSDSISVEISNNSNNNNNNSIDEISTNLEIASNQFEVPSDYHNHQFQMDITCSALKAVHSNAKDENLGLNLNALEKSMQSALSLQDKGKLNSHNSLGMPTTPDILMENWNTHHIDHELKNANPPDILCGVTSPKNPPESVNASGNQFNLENPDDELRNETEAQFFSSYSLRDEVSLGLTPVDIIGDFGQEVEREFGLLVSGYKRETACENLESMKTVFSRKDKLADAALSLATDQLDTSRYSEQTEANPTPPNDTDIHDNAVDLPLTCSENVNQEITEPSKKPVYNKCSYDDRLLPPVAIEYKKCHQSQRNAKKSHLRLRTHTKSTTNPRQQQYKRSGKVNNNSSRKQNEEFQQYQKLLNDKEQILNKSKYAKVASWAQYLNDQQKRRNSSDILTPSALELFEAYKIGGDIDQETLEKHLHLAKEIEKKRRSDREEIRKRLAKGAENYRELSSSRKPAWNTNLSTRLQLSENIAYDTETNSSDSESCPKLSLTKPTASRNECDVPAREQDQNPFYRLENSKGYEARAEQQNISDAFYSQEDNECDFFTKQAKLQIETRMALAQAKNMAHRQMEVDRHNQSISPITAVIRGSLTTIGVSCFDDKRRVSRQMLTHMNIAQLQILLNNLHAHIEQLNESLVKHLMERDDLHVRQDAMLVDIEELTRYIGAKEQIAQQQQRLSFLRKLSK